MTMDVKSEVPQAQQSGTPQKCAGCGKPITERYLLKALDMLWHEDCLKCGCCDCRLGEVGSTLYTKANLILCKRDYLRLFGNTGYCAACSKVIPAFEMVMRARHNVYHLECFACQQCSHRFCVGDRFYLCENKILCEYDYEERLVFANMAYNPPALAHLKRAAVSSSHGGPGQGQVGPGQVGPGQIGPGQVGPGHLGGPQCSVDLGPVGHGGQVGSRSQPPAQHPQISVSGTSTATSNSGGAVTTNGFHGGNVGDALGTTAK